MKSESAIRDQLLKIIHDSKVEGRKVLSFSSLDFSELKEPLIEFPEEIFELTELEDLSFLPFEINSIPDGFQRLKKLRVLNLKFTGQYFPIELLNIPALFHLSVFGNFSVLPKEMDLWKSLRYLNVNSPLKNIYGIPPNLSYLYIRGGNFDYFPNRVLELKGLNKIVLSKFSPGSILLESFDFPNLTSLFLPDCQLEKLPLSLINLKNLRELNIRGNRFLEIPEVVFKFKKLEVLNLADNNVGDVPHKITGLKNLKELNMRGNPLNSYPIAVNKLTSLVELSIGSGYFGIPDFLKKKTFYLPNDFLNLVNLKKLDIFNIEFENVPKEISKSGVGAIRNYLISKKEAESEEFLYEAKMVVVGRGNAGKTVLTKKLTNPVYRFQNEESTKGISIFKHPWLIGLKNNGVEDSFKFNIWDFGGQEKYDATHQLFITNNSVYLFVTEARQESNYMDFHYWLNTIKVFGSNSPVIVVLTKMDERQKRLPQSKYLDKFPNIVDFISVSCVEGYEDTLQNLHRSIESAVQMLPQVSQKFSNKWVAIRNHLETISEHLDYISYDEYLAICQDYSLKSTQAGFLSEFLHNLGVIIHHKNDLVLGKTVFVKTDWCVDGIYMVLDDDQVFKNMGKITDSMLMSIWSDNRFKNKEIDLLRLMIKYDLCFELKDASGYIIPSQLPVDPPNDLYFKSNQSHHLLIEYRYDFMPAGILSRFIVKAHGFISGSDYWRFGVRMEHEETEAIVEEDFLNKRIKIELAGNNKKGLLSAIRMLINEVHRDFDKNEKLSFVEMVPCNCPVCSEGDIPHFYKFEPLKKFDDKGVREVHCDVSALPVSVKGLIDDVQLNLDYTDFESEVELKDWIEQIIKSKLIHEIRFKEGFVNFWRDQKMNNPKSEIEFQPFICSTIDNFCKVKGINLSREVKEGSGFVDVLFTYTNKKNEILKVCLEIKKAHHQSITTGVYKQLPIYMESVGTSQGIYMPIWFKSTDYSKPVQYRDLDHLEEAICKNNNIGGISVLTLDVTKPISPSNA